MNFTGISTRSAKQDLIQFFCSGFSSPVIGGTSMLSSQQLPINGVVTS